MGRLQNAVKLVAIAILTVSLRLTTAKTKKTKDNKVAEFETILAHLYKLFGVFLSKNEEMKAPRIPNAFRRMPSREPYATENFPKGAIN